MNHRIFYITGIISVLIVFTSSILLVTTSVIGFDFSGIMGRDCVPYNVFLEKGSNEYSVSVRWSTKGQCVGFVQYGNERKNLDMVVVDLTNEHKSKEHQVEIKNLLSEESYFFLINSQDQAYGNNGIPLEFSLKNF